jgi:hypothetical protein
MSFRNTVIKETYILIDYNIKQICRYGLLELAQSEQKEIIWKLS